MPRNTPLSRSLTALAALACAVVALLPSTVASATAVADGQLSGRVQDHSGIAAAGAEVTLADSATQATVARTTTDAKGAYTLAVPQGTYDASVTAPGANGAKKVGRLRGISVGAASKLTVALIPPPEAQATFSGTVRDRNGAPVSGVNLSLSSNSIYKSVTTGADGRFSLGGPTGRYSLSVNGNSSISGAALPSNWGFYTNTFDLTGDLARDITIPGKDITVTVKTESGVGLAGTPVSVGTYSTNHSVELFPGLGASSMWNFQGTTDAAGKVKFVGLPHDSVYVNATPGDQTLSRSYKTVSISGDKTISLVARPTVAFTGLARDYNGAPLVGASVSLNNAETNSGATTDSDGRFVVRAAKGSYTLWLHSHPYSSGSPADTITVSVPLELTGDLTQDLTVPGTVLRAHVTDPSGAPVAGVNTFARQSYTAGSEATVSLFPGVAGTGRRESYRTTDGSGNAMLVVFDHSDVTVTARPSDPALAPATPRPMTVEWGMACPGGDRDWSHPVSGQCLAEMALRPTVSVHGVVDPAAPLAGTRVVAIDNNNSAGSVWYEATTGADGSYDLRMPVGTVDTVSISACCSNSATDRPSHWNIQGGPLAVAGDTTLNLAAPFVHPTIRAYDADGRLVQLGATAYSTETGSESVGGSLGPGLPAKNGFLSGSAYSGNGPNFGYENRLSVFKSSPFRVQQYYMPAPVPSGLMPTMNATGLSAAGDDGIALVLVAIVGGPPPTSTTTTTTTGGTGPTTSTSTTTTTTTPPSGSGTTTTTAQPGGEAGKASAPGRSGYWMVTADGEVHAFGDAKHYGQPRGAGLGGARAVDLEPTRSGLGYWVLDDRGHVHAYGDAKDLGDVDPARLTTGEKAASLSATSSGAGYWIFTDRGRVLTFGDAAFFGDLSKIKLNGPVLGSVATPSGKGYWMVASDGGIFTFGDATFHGSTGKIRLNKPVMGMAPAPGGGYWLVASDGGIFAFDVPFFGSMGAVRLNKPISGMVPGRNGYLMVAEDGGIFSFGDVAFSGSLGARPPASPVVSVALLP